MAVIACGMALAVVACGQKQDAQSAPAADSKAAATPAAVTSTPAGSYDLTPESNAKFLADYKAKPGVMARPSGLLYRVLKSGTGAGVKSGEDMVTVTYKGSLIDGKVFDQTGPGETATFPAGMLIPGWVEALGLMKEGDAWEIVIPSELGYGAQGAGGDIPPNQTLVFQMELLHVDPAK
jgi:FKBP-type peptidyl-prolyl cis-trans isomerase